MKYLSKILIAIFLPVVFVLLQFFKILSTDKLILAAVDLIKGWIDVLLWPVLIFIIVFFVSIIIYLIQQKIKGQLKINYHLIGKWFAGVVLGLIILFIIIKGWITLLFLAQIPLLIVLTVLTVIYILIGKPKINFSQKIALGLIFFTLDFASMSLLKKIFQNTLFAASANFITYESVLAIILPFSIFCLLGLVPLSIYLLFKKGPEILSIKFYVILFVILIILFTLLTLLSNNIELKNFLANFKVETYETYICNWSSDNLQPQKSKQEEPSCYKQFYKGVTSKVVCDYVGGKYERYSGAWGADYWSKCEVQPKK